VTFEIENRESVLLYNIVHYEKTTILHLTIITTRVSASIKSI